MWYFSLRHSLQIPVTGLNGFPLSIIFHLMVYGTGGLWSLRAQMWVEPLSEHLVGQCRQGVLVEDFVLSVA